MKDIFMMNSAEVIHFNDESQAVVLKVSPTIKPMTVLQQLNLLSYRAAIFLHSGAAEMIEVDLDRLQLAFTEGLARFAQDHNILIADGGTDVGGMHLIGQARRAIKGTFPLLGVSVTGKVSYPNGPQPEQGRFPLNDGHSHFVLVESESFGAESDLLVGLATARPVPRVALVVNGGSIVEEEAKRHAEQGTPIITIKGSLRFADELANNLTSGRIRLTYPMGTKVRTFDVLKQTPRDLYDLLKKMLFEH
ncbi:MAG: hypothetical protein CUN55_01940 [Phototrophicales bacterium]|nr:MAG: hypothetical protein CUN55_01940 [Phototrophicales bacterium]